MRRKEGRNRKEEKEDFSFFLFPLFIALLYFFFHLWGVEVDSAVAAKGRRNIARGAYSQSGNLSLVDPPDGQFGNLGDPEGGVDVSETWGVQVNREE